MTEAVRLARNLDTVEANIRLFGKIMDETDIPGTENANDKKLLEKLDGACHKMQERLTILLSELDPENYENVFMNGLRNLDTRHSINCRSSNGTPSHLSVPFEIRSQNQYVEIHWFIDFSAEFQTKPLVAQCYFI